MRPRFATRLLVATVLVSFASLPGLAHSIETHRNLTTAAVGWLLEAQPKLQCTGNGKDQLINALQVGTEHEDDNYENSSSSARMGRYMFHFLPTLSDQLSVIEITPIKALGLSVNLGAVDFGIVKSNGCDSRRWGGFDTNSAGSVTCSYHVTKLQDLSITNQNTWGNALAAAKTANSSYAGFSDGFVKLGYLMHLVEDQSSPAHALNASHGYLPLPLDSLAILDPALRGVTLDLGFPDAMETSRDGGAANRPVPAGLWPARNASLLLDAAPGDILQAMHDKVKSLGYRRENMTDRTARMFAGVVKNVDAKLPGVVKGVGLPWPIGTESLSQDLTTLKKNVAQLITSEIKNAVNEEFTYAMRSASQADAEFTNLAPEAVRLSASLLWKYINQTNPVMGSGTNSCSIKP